MSMSINQLLKGLTAKQPRDEDNEEIMPQPTEKGKIYNPDVPDTYVGENDDDFSEYRLHGKSQYTDEFDFNKIAHPRSGDYFRLPVKDLMSEEKRRFLLTGSIDPNMKRLTSDDPSGAMPFDFETQGSEDVNFDVRDDKGIFTTTSAVDEYQTALRSFANYRDRFNLPTATTSNVTTSPNLYLPQVYEDHEYDNLNYVY